MPLSPEQIEAVTKQFGASALSVMKCLESYGGEEWHREPNRVRAGILGLANGDVAAVKELTEEAKSDYRNILYWLTFDEHGNPPPLPTFNSDNSPKVPPDVSADLLGRDVTLTVLHSGGEAPRAVAVNPEYSEIRKIVFDLTWDDMTFVTASIDEDNWLDGSGSLNPEEGLCISCCINGVEYLTQGTDTLDRIVDLLHEFVNRRGGWRTSVVWT